MIGADALAAKHLALMEAAQQAGEDVYPHVVETYAAFARNAAKNWWLRRSTIAAAKADPGLWSAIVAEIGRRCKGGDA